MEKTLSLGEYEMILETERLYLRQLTESDFGSLCKILRDEETMYAYNGAFSVSEVQDWLDKQLARYEEYGFGLWAAVLKETDRVIGQCGLTMQDWNGREVLKSDTCFKKNTGTRGTPRKPPKPARSTLFQGLARMRYAPLSGTQIPPRRTSLCETV